MEQRRNAESDYLKVVELATAEIQMWEEDHPILGPVYFRRGVAYETLGDIEQARADYEMVTELQTGGEIGREVAEKLQMLAPNN